MSYQSRINYEFRETRDFLAHVQRILGSVQRWDEIKESIDLDLVRDPYIGHLVPGTYVHAVAIRSNPPLTLYYHINEQTHIINPLEIHLI